MNTPNAGWIDGVEPGDADLAALLRAVPERPFRDVSGAVVQTIVHRRRRRRMAFAGFWAAAAAAALVVMTWLPSTPVAVRPPVEAVAASRAAEDWLLTAQEADGTWDPARWGGSREYRPAVTGFAMMALVRDGDAAADGAAARAAQALRGMQGRDGRLGGARALHNHAIATGALASGAGAATTSFWLPPTYAAASAPAVSSVRPAMLASAQAVPADQQAWPSRLVGACAA